MQIPILNGIYTDNNADFRTSYPINLIPVPKSSGISEGYLSQANGIVKFCDTSAIDRGGINWENVMYRVIGTRLVKVLSDGTIEYIGDVGGSGQVTMGYSFDRLAIASSNKFYLYNKTTLQQVTDADLGNVLDFVWVDGYFMTTDGTFLVVTELNNPFEVNPLKYGSSEADPDRINALLKVRNEVCALNRYTIEVFNNVGGANFPFERIESAQIQKGTLGTHCNCVVDDFIVFLGSGRNESPSIYIGSNASATKIATREIDQILQEYTEDTLSNCLMESKSDKSSVIIYLHLPDKTLCYDLGASQSAEVPVWFILNSNGKYKANNIVWCYNKWISGDPTSNRLGYFDNSISSHYDEIIIWEFGTQILYNNSMGAVIHQLELVSLTGRVKLGYNPTISTQYSLDGVTWSNERFIKIGTIGDRTKRIVWFSQGIMRNFRIQRFRGTSDSYMSIARLEAKLEGLNG